MRVEVITILNETMELLTGDVLTHGERKEFIEVLKVIILESNIYLYENNAKKETKNPT